jgi:hypothetical protein
MFGGRLSRQPGSSTFDVVACALNLIDEVLHIGRKATRHEHVDVEVLRRRELLRLIEPRFHQLQCVNALRDNRIVHEAFPFLRPILWAHYQL